VLVVGGAEPEADRVDAARLRAVLGLAGDLGLVGIDARVVVLSVDAGDVVERALFWVMAAPMKPSLKM